MPLARENRFSLFCQCPPEDRAWLGIVRCTVVPPENALEDFWLRIAARYAGSVFCERCCRVAAPEECHIDIGSMTLTGLAYVLQTTAQRLAENDRSGIPG